MAKKRTMDTVSEKLPKTPEKKATVITLLINSPGTRKILEESWVILSEKKQSQFKLFCAVNNDDNSFWSSGRALATLALLGIRATLNENA